MKNKRNNFGTVLALALMVCLFLTLSTTQQVKAATGYRTLDVSTISAEGVADNTAIPEGTTYCDGFFRIEGQVTQRVSMDGKTTALELGKAESGKITFTLTDTAKITFQVSSVAEDATTEIVLTGNGGVIPNDDWISLVSGITPTTMVYSELPAGEYSFFCWPTEDYDNAGWLLSIQAVLSNVQTDYPVELPGSLLLGEDGLWAYYVDGVVDTEYTGLVKNESGIWYVKNGYLDWNYTDLFCAETGWYYVMDGRVPTEYSGLVRNTEGLWYVEGGMINWNHTGLVSSAEGWYYVLNGRVTEEYTGLVRNEEGLWYVAGGKLDESHTDLVSSEEGWFYVMNGRVTEEYTGLVSNSEGTWYIDGGKLDWEHTGLVSSLTGWWYVLNGRVTKEYVGLVENENGIWYVENGSISFKHTGLVSDATGWWYVINSEVAKDYTGLASNDAGTWYVQGGYLDFDFNGVISFEEKGYIITGGMVTGETMAPVKVSKLFASGLEVTPYNNSGESYGDAWWGDSEVCAYIEGASNEITKGNYGATVYIPDHALEDGRYGVELSICTERSPYSYIDYTDAQFEIINGTIVEEYINDKYERISGGYLIQLSSSYELKEALSNYVWIAKIHTECAGENGSIYFGDFYTEDENLGLKYLNLDSSMYEYSMERLCTGESLETGIQCLAPVDIKNAVKQLLVGEELDLVVNGVSNNENVSYVSSDKSVVQVQADGSLYAMGAGKAVITVVDEENEVAYAWNLIVTEEIDFSEVGKAALFEKGLAVELYNNNGEAYDNWWYESELNVNAEYISIKALRGTFGMDIYFPEGSLLPGQYGVELWVQTDDGSDICGYNSNFTLGDGYISGSDITKLDTGFMISQRLPYLLDEAVEVCNITLKIHSDTTEENGALYFGNIYLADVVYGYQSIDLMEDSAAISAERISTGEEIAIGEQSFFTGVKKAVTSIYLGETAEIEIVEGREEGLDFYVDDYAVATVDKKGVVTGMSVGTTKLTVIDADGVEISWLLTVSEPHVGLAYEKSSVALGTTYQYVGKGFGLASTDFIWSSSEEAVGIIDAETGLFTALADGTTDITLMDTISGKKYTFTVTVYSVSNSELAEYISIETNNMISSELEQKITELLYIVYPKIFDYFADGEYNKVSCTFIELDGVAYTVGRDMFISADYINSNPADVDCITHELIHCAQYYPGGEIWLIEGITDYGRSLFGEYNEEANWSLATYQEGQSYTDSYGVTGGFLKYVVENHNSNMVLILNQHLKTGSCPDSVWVENTGYTIDELWNLYAAQ